MLTEEIINRALESIVVSEESVRFDSDLKIDTRAKYFAISLDEQGNLLNTHILKSKVEVCKFASEVLSARSASQYGSIDYYEVFDCQGKRVKIQVDRINIR